ncbi:MAG: tetratricopeptide repeat protein [Candidatus Omnitrophica bacterium]|nr:tetratricopeptide repeat protein [Candidatus Omnitrophota bacterium]
MPKLSKEKVKDKKSKIKETNLIKENIREKRQLAIVEKYQEKTKVASKKNKKAYIKALYREGFYCYKIGEYELAKEAFNKVLELDPTQLKAADYLHIYIPEAEKDAAIKGR